MSGLGFTFDNFSGVGTVRDSSGSTWVIKDIDEVNIEHHLAALNLGADINVSTKYFVTLEQYEGTALVNGKAVPLTGGIVKLPVKRIDMGRFNKIINIEFDELRWSDEK